MSFMDVARGARRRFMRRDWAIVRRAKAAFQAIVRDLYMMAALWGITRPRELLAASTESDDDLLPYFEPVLPGSYPSTPTSATGFEWVDTTEKTVLPEKMEIDATEAVPTKPPIELKPIQLNFSPKYPRATPRNRTAPLAVPKGLSPEEQDLFYAQHTPLPVEGRSFVQDSTQLRRSMRIAERVAQVVTFPKRRLHSPFAISPDQIPISPDDPYLEAPLLTKYPNPSIPRRGQVAEPVDKTPSPGRVQAPKELAGVSIPQRYQRMPKAKTSPSQDLPSTPSHSNKMPATIQDIDFRTVAANIYAITRNSQRPAEKSGQAFVPHPGSFPRPGFKYCTHTPDGRQLSVIERLRQIPLRKDMDPVEKARIEKIIKERKAREVLEAIAEVKNITAKRQHAEHLKAIAEGRVPQSQRAVKPLTDEWNWKVDRAMQIDDRTTVLATTPTNATITRKDFGTLLPGKGDPANGWLNDEIINNYLELVTRHANRGQVPGATPKFHAFNSFFYKKLSGSGLKMLDRWSKRAKIDKSNLLKVDYVFIPVNQGLHWTILVVCPTKKTIAYYDSFGDAGTHKIMQTFKWLQHELKNEFKREEWTILPPDSGRQQNGSDCGVFLCTTAKMLSLGLDPLSAYDQSDIPLQRRRMAAELMGATYE